MNSMYKKKMSYTIRTIANVLRKHIRSSKFEFKSLWVTCNCDDSIL